MKKVSYILVYHRVSQENLNIFEKQIKYLKENRKIVPINEITSLSPNSIIITFDDGFFDNFVYAYPILLKYKVPFTIFLATAYLKKEGIRKNLFDYFEGKVTLDELKKVNKNINFNEYPNNEFLTWEEVKLMHKSGFADFQCHGFTHKVHICDISAKKVLERRIKYLDLDRSKIKDNYIIKSQFVGFRYLIDSNSFETVEKREKRLLTEFNNCKNDIKNNLGYIPEHFCWPWGEYDEISLKIAKDVGFKFFYTTQKGSIDEKFCNWDKIPRISASYKYNNFKKRDLIFSNSLLSKCYMLFFK